MKLLTEERQSKESKRGSTNENEWRGWFERKAEKEDSGSQVRKAEREIFKGDKRERERERERERVKLVGKNDGV